MTFRGVVEKDIPIIAEFIHTAFQVNYFYLTLRNSNSQQEQYFQIALDAQKLSGPKLVDWNKILVENSSLKKRVEEVKAKVEEFVTHFLLPGREDI